MVSEKKTFFFVFWFSHYKSMGAIYEYDGHLDLRTMVICTNCVSPLNTRLRMKFEDIWLRGFRGKVVQRCEHTGDRRADDGKRTGSDHNSSP